MGVSEVSGVGARFIAPFLYSREAAKKNFPLPQAVRGVGERVRQTPARLRRAPPFKRGLFFFAASREVIPGWRFAYPGYALRGAKRRRRIQKHRAR